MKYLYLLCLLIAGSFAASAQSPGNALNFDGSDDYVSFALPTVFDDISTKDHTIEAWVNASAFSTSRLLHAQVRDSNFVSVLINGSGEVFYYVNANGSSNTYNVSSSLPLNTWTHLAFTWDADNSQCAIYYNGVEQVTSTGGTSSAGADSAMAIGAKSGGTQYFNGSMDELRIWNTVRTECQISSNLNATLGGNEVGLAHYYNFNNGTAGGTNTGVTNLADASGAVSGTLQNFGLVGSSSNWVTSMVNIIYTGQQTTSTTTITLDQVCSGDSYTFPSGTVLTNITADVSDTNFLQTSLGCDSFVVVQLSVNPSYFNTSSASICSGDSYTFPSGTVLTNITADVSDTNFLQTSLGCDSIEVVELTVDPLPTPLVTVAGIDLSTAAYDDIEWYLDGAAISGASDSTLTATASGSYSVLVTDGNGCAAFSDTVNVTIVGIAEQMSTVGIKLFPNPASHILNVSIDLDRGAMVDLLLLDMSGRVVNSTAFYAEAGNSINTLDLAQLDSGIYLLQVTANGKNQMRKVAKY